MKKILAIIIVASIVPISLFSKASNDFNSSMQTDEYAESINLTKVRVGIDGHKLLTFFQKLYEKNNLAILQPSTIIKIPKIIHQIWLGSPLPPVFGELTQTWKKMHLGRGWRYKLWTDEDVKSMKLYNQQFYDATDNVGVKSDILRWEILYRYGGVYVDTDFECLQSLDALHYVYDFYTGIQPLDTGALQLGAALCGSVPKHPILKHCIETVKNDWKKKEQH